MALLNNEHIDYITRDLRYRGIVLDELKEELVDHVCSGVEAEMLKGKRFIDAYHEVLKSFGHTSGLRHTQLQALQFKNKRTSIMLKNYLTIAWRTLHRQRFYSVINIAGLALGVAAALVIGLFVADELSYDRHHEKGCLIFRLESDVMRENNQWHTKKSPAPTANALQQDYPEIEAAVRFIQYGTYLVKTREGAENSKEHNVAWTDSTFFKIFSVNVLEGNPRAALTIPKGVAISKRIADKYFPNTSALNQSVILDNNYHTTVTAVYENMPSTSHLNFDILVPLLGDLPPAKGARKMDFFSNFDYATYILLKEGSQADALEAKLPGFVEKYVVGQSSKKDFTLQKFHAAGNRYDMHLVPLLDIHLYADGNITYVYLFSIIAVFILMIACINFMNLSTARSGNRAREVGMRKVMGSLRSHLIKQFLIESILITVFAFGCAIVLAYLCLPFFNELSLKELELPLTSAIFYALIATAAIVVGILAGIYPSFYLSAFRPVKVLKGETSAGVGRSFTRSTLVVFQFAISIVLIVAAITVNKQLHYIQNKKLGYDKEQVIIVHDGYALRPNKVEHFKNEALDLSSIQTGTVSSFVPVLAVNAARGDKTFYRDGNAPTLDNLISLQNWAVDYGYIETFKLNVKKGRGFSEDFPSDVSAVVLNEKAVEQLGLGDEPIGKKINSYNKAGQSDTSPDIESWTVIGVVEDFHFASLRQDIVPLSLRLGKTDTFISFRFQASNPIDVVRSLEQTWKSMAPDQPFHFSFLDDEFERTYASEQRLGKIFTVFAVLAIAIASLGVFALTAFTVDQRTREIGIRKVLGASVNSIVVLLSQDIGRLMVIAWLVALPLSWFGITKWLEGYAYKTDVGADIYLLAGGLAVVTALITISYQAINAALANPVNSLRHE